MENKEQKTFQELKAEFSFPETCEDRKKELIILMQENLKQRCDEESGIVKCLDGKNHSLDSDDVGELSVIDSYLRGLERKKERDEISEIYTPENPYTGK